MQPSSDSSGSSGDNGGGSALKRFGPVAAIVAVIAIVVGVVVFSSGDDSTDEPDETTQSTDGTDAPATAGAPGAITYDQAQEEGLDVTFMDTCDTETGNVAIPFFNPPDCYANVDDNGGATSPGVTADTISVVYWNAPDVDPTLDFVTAPIANDDTAEEIRDTVLDYVDMFNEFYQLYGRQVEVHVIQGGTSEDSVTARATAKQAIEEFAPFAAFGGPALTNAWSDEMAQNGVVCIGCGATGGQDFLAERQPFLYGGMSGNQLNLHGAEYIAARLKDGKAEFGGDEVKDQDRVFGHLYITTGEESEKNAEVLYDQLEQRGITIADENKQNYELTAEAIGRLPETATSIIQKFKNQGVTSIIIQADPVAPSFFTTAATDQEYFPEWVIVGGTLVDTNVFGRVFGQDQWTHAFGISTLAVRTDPNLQSAIFVHKWYTGDPEPPAPDTAPVLLAAPAGLFAGLQAAGPTLTPENYQLGAFAAAPPEEHGFLNAVSTFGEHGLWDDIGITLDLGGTDDMTEIWWDADAEGVDELDEQGSGLYKFVDGGRRYYSSEWADSTGVPFADAGAESFLVDLPPSETPKDYPSPAGS